MILVRRINLLVFGLIRWTHIPIEPILQPRRLVFVFYPLELLLSSAEGAVGLGKMRL